MIFLDTSALIALADRRDRNHDRAVRFFREAVKRTRFVLAKHVLIEYIDGVTKRIGRRGRERAQEYSEQQADRRPARQTEGAEGGVHIRLRLQSPRVQDRTGISYRSDKAQPVGRLESRKSS